jgi:hypothetical protein
LFKGPYEEAKEFALKFDFHRDLNVSLFETTIRIIGGLLGAYELSPDPSLITKATDLADRLLWAFNTSIGIPFPSINLLTHRGINKRKIKTKN